MEVDGKQYKHIISLGYFCSVALELERLGIRKCSYPFDWCISEWTGVKNTIENHFKDFLTYDYLYQNKAEHSIYRNKEGISFYHDFNEYQPLSEQIENVKRKYERRIARFYQDICEPTLFIRYISGENGMSEVNEIEKNIQNILCLLKSYNPNNEILFIANAELHSDVIDIFYVEKDKDDVVARRPFEKNRELLNYIGNITDVIIGGGRAA